RQAPSVREPRHIPGEEAEAFSTSRRGWRNTRIQTKEIGYRPGILRTAPGTNWSRVDYQRQEVRARGPWNRNANRAEYSREQWIEEEVRKLCIVLRIIHAEAVFGSCPDDEFIDQRIPLSLNLLPGSRVQCSSVGAANCDLAP